MESYYLCKDETMNDQLLCGLKLNLCNLQPVHHPDRSQRRLLIWTTWTHSWCRFIRHNLMTDSSAGVHEAAGEHAATSCTSHQIPVYKRPQREV